jgi:hypothetical protein
VGYDLTGEDHFFIEACERSRHLLVDELDRPFYEFETQRDLADALEEVSNLPSAGEGPSFRDATRSGHSLAGCESLGGHTLLMCRILSTGSTIEMI